MDVLSAGQNLNDPKIKNQIAAQVLPLIEDLPTPMERETYRQALSRMLKVDERALQIQPVAPKVTRRPRAAEQSRHVNQPVAAVNPNLKVESYCLGVLFRKPALLYRLDRKLQEFGLSALAVEDFEYTDHQLLFSVVRQAVEQDEKDHHHFAMSNLPEPMGSFSKDILAQEEDLPLEDKLVEELVARFIDLRRAHAMTNISQLRFLQEEEQQQGSANIKPYQEQTLQFTRLLNSLDQAKKKTLSKR
jgi:DNA primase